MTAVTITVFGRPAPQGSKRHVGNGVMVESSEHLKSWREDVRAACLAEFERTPDWDPFREGPLDVEITFTLPKPASAPKRTTSWPNRRPDIDKLFRATLDAIGSSGLWHDDAQVVELTGRKVFPQEGVDALDRPGALIHIRTLGVTP